jgi:NAD-dependent SIR2 family protein deacetylase
MLPVSPMADLPEALLPRLAQAAELIQQADALVVAAGAGMGVDSGMPDFRGPQGFWRAYPALAQANLRFVEVANPQAFMRSPRLAWGFYGHRLAMYRRLAPHAGFGILRTWGERLPHGCAVFTSNVDGHFQRAGFDEGLIEECHGSIHHLQCMGPCGEHIWLADGFQPEVDDTQCLLMNEPPRCPHCQGLARPNILMFGDAAWLSRRADEQAARLQAWLRRTSRPLVIEVGAGVDVPTVRHFSHAVVRAGGRLLRINPDECAVPSRLDVGLPLGGLAALRALVATLAGGDAQGP